MASLTAALRARLRRATRPTEPDTTSGELNITPFLDVVVNLVLFLLATTSAVLTTSEVEASLPPTCGRCDRGSHVEPGEQLSVTLTRGGAIVASRHGVFAAGCERFGGPGTVAVPWSGAVDREALGHCAEALRHGAPDEHAVILSAEPTVPYADLIAAMDALRGTAEAPVFRDVLLSAGVR